MPFLLVAAASLGAMPILGACRSSPQTKVAPPPKQDLPPLLARPKSDRNVITEAPLHSLKAHHGGAFAVDVSRDGKWIASGGGDGVAKVWDASTGDEVASIAGAGGRVYSVAFTPDARRVVLPAGKNVWVWERGAHAPALSIEADATEVELAAVSPDGRWVATTGRTTRAVRLWDLATGAAIRLLSPEPSKTQLGLRFSHDGKTIASGGEDRVVRVWNVGDGSLAGTYAGHLSTIDALAFLADDSIGTTSDDRTLRLWRRDGASAGVLADHGDEVWAFASSPVTTLAATGGKDGEIRFWDAAKRSMRWEIQDGSRGATSLAFFPDDSAVAAAQTNGLVNVWAVPGRTHSSLPAPPKLTETPALGPSPTAARECARAMALVDGYGGLEPTLAEAEKLAHDAVQRKPDFALAYVVLARVAYRRGYSSGITYDQSAMTSAISLTDNALALDPSLAAAHVARGWALRGRKDAAGASKEAQAALEHGSSAAANVLRGQLAIDDDGGPKDADDAVLYATRALAASPTRGEAWLAYEVLAGGYLGRGEDDAADAAYRAAVDVLPDSAWPKGNYANFLTRTGAYARAIEEAKLAVAQSDYGMGRARLSGAQVEQGIVLLWDQDRPEDARASFESALSADPTNGAAHYGLGAYWRQRAVLAADPTALGKSDSELAQAASAGDALAKAALKEEALASGKDSR
jgi:WD40 repeat protein